MMTNPQLICHRAVAPEDVGGRWAPFRLRPYDRICAQWLILHKVDNNDQMRCETISSLALKLPVSCVIDHTYCFWDRVTACAI